MRSVLASALLLTAPFLGACGGDDTIATDTASALPGPMPTEVPAAPGKVRTLHIATVMDKGSPELCLGAVAESWPPQCGGPAIAGWDWSDHRGMFESDHGVKWGQFAVTGTWDGETLTCENAVPAALYDPMTGPPEVRPEPADDLSDSELDDLAEEVGQLPGASGAYVDAGQVLVDVLYDDGSLQDWADGTYGRDVVLVTSMLVDDV